MIIQHILTADIFNVVFDEPHFHRENNIAKELEMVIDTFSLAQPGRMLLSQSNTIIKPSMPQRPVLLIIMKNRSS